MAEVTLFVGGRSHVVACRDGEEAELQALGQRLNAHADVAQRVAGGQGGERTLLFIALMLADELLEAERAPGGNGAASAATLNRIAERLEALADTLEKSPGTA